MTIYCILFITIFLIKMISTRSIYSGNIEFARKNKNDETIALFVVCSIIFLLMGLRSTSVGCDLVQYVHRYKILSYDSIYNTSEWGYNILCYFFRDILHLDFQWLIIFVSLLLMSSFYFCFKSFSEDWIISVIFYLTLGTFTLAMSGVRQTISIALCNYAIFFVKKRKLILFILFVLIASTFHNSALVFLITYFIYGIRFTRKSAAICFFVFLLGFIFRRYIVELINIVRPPKYSNIDLSEGYSINPLVILAPIIINIYSLLFIPTDSCGRFTKKDSFFFLLSCVYILTLILSLNNNQLGRLGFYFSIGQMINVATAVKNHKQSNFMEGTIMFVLIILFCLAYFFISTPGGTLGIDKYTFFWD